ncbi:class I SAM-dependent methyltransferase [Fusibacter sp. JL298sf-3]
MLNSKGFDLWADGYDKSVNISEERDAYPFAGYKSVLGTIYSTIMQEKGKQILDVGFGTGILTKRLYDAGCLVTGIDFSDRMIEIAKSKMPSADLFQHDFTKGLPCSLSNIEFDFIICTYAIHHLNTPQKISFIRQMVEHLSANGKVLIGDVAFSTNVEMEACKVKSGDAWDSDEVYPVAEMLYSEFPNMVFEKIGFCSGIFTFTK